MFLSKNSSKKQEQKDNNDYDSEINPKYIRPRQESQSGAPRKMYPNKQNYFSPYERSGRSTSNDHSLNDQKSNYNTNSHNQHASQRSHHSGSVDSLIDRRRRDESQSSTGQQKQFSSEEMKRKIYVGNLPENATENNIQQFFSRIGLVKNVQLKPHKHFAFVEFVSQDDARKAISETDETNFMGQQIRVKSTDKNRSKAADPNNPNRLFIGYIPHQMSEQQIRELFETLGHLNYFFLVMDTQTGKSKGYAFCEYEDISITSTAIERLHGRDIMGKRLVVQRAYDPEKRSANTQKLVHQLVNYKENTLESSLASLSDIYQNPNYTPTNMIQLLNMFDPEEYRNNQKKIETLIQEILEEADRYGSVLEMIVPIPDLDPDGEGSWKDGFGRVFIQFGNIQEANKALNNMNGKTFHGRLIICSYFSEEDMNKAMKERSFEGINQ